MKFKLKYKFCLWKRYFDTGYGITSYLKYFIAFFGLASQDVLTTLLIGIVYGLSCFGIGYYWLHSGFYRAETEVGNQYNPFVSQMRKKIGIKSK